MAAAPAGSRTPSPPSGIRTPPAPRFGYQDDWQPYAPRKSARISSQQQSAHRTPSPRAAHRPQARSPRVVKNANAAQTAASMVSPFPSPQKKRQPMQQDSSRRVSGTLTAEGTASAATALGLQDKPTRGPTNTSVSQAAGMLPTPSKTPQKPPSEQTATNIKSIARNLFSEDDTALSSKTRRSKKYSGMTMESFAAEGIEDPIAIFTDSQDRVPQKDDSASNPFFGDVAASEEPTKRRSKRRQVHIPGEGVEDVETAARRVDGLVYVFRGRKLFRKYADDEDMEEGEGDDDSLNRPLTRSSITPRLLFPVPKPDGVDEDEEAATDVEDMSTEDAQLAPQTPTKPSHKQLETPEAPRFAPVSPPDTRRTTRSTNKLPDDGTPLKGKGRRSPFDSWPRTKEHKESSTAKRHGDGLTPAHAKRPRA